ncbi:MAG: aminotransferase class III-fold pyridoxal phosphate-dependent enzyme, partial [Planctomycetota bacterium]|nr:aminotransferase class III-fold pyridoxal phosphate-dependent enzyme [Planctomycetota bacterium]
RDCEKRLGISPIDSVDALSASLLLANTPTLAHPGYLVAVEGAFHGKTLGSLGLTWNPEARKPFVRGKPNVIFLSPGEASLEMEEEESRGLLYGIDVDNLTVVEQPFGLFVAIFMEPIRGEGGIVEVEEDVLNVIREFRERHPEVPVVIDEIQSGLGRTGLVFESLRQKLPIDYMCMGKALGGGLCKVSALAIERSRYCREFSLLHSSTFSEDELSSEVAHRFLELIEEDDLPGRSARLGERIIERMVALQKKWPGVIAAVRGQGLMLGVEFVDQSRSRSNAIRALSLEERLTVILAGYLLHEHKIRVLPTLGRRSTLRLEPSAYMTEDDLDVVVRGFEGACEILARANAGRLLHYLVAKGAPPSSEPVTDYSGLPERFDERSEVRSRVAFMGHMILTEHIPLWDPSLTELTRPELERLSWRVMGAINPHVYTRRIIRSVTGAATELSFLGIFMTSNQIEKDMRLNRSRLIFSQVKKALDLARRLGCSVVGFGGYTSIVTRNLRVLHEDRPALTTGNALTVGIGHEAIKESCAELNFDLKTVRAAVCGGTGNIGRVHARLLAAEVSSLVIVGRPGSTDRLLTVVGDIVEELRRAVKEGREGGILLERFGEAYRSLENADAMDARALMEVFTERGKSLVDVSEDLSCLRDVDVIVTASNSAKPIIEPEHLHQEKPVLICDIAVPGDVSRRVRKECPNVSVILG